MQPKVINRRYYDEYFYNLSIDCVNKLGYPVIYENLTKNWIDIVSKQKESCIVIFPDYLIDGTGYCRFTESDKTLLNNLDKKIFLVSSVRNAHLDFNFPNIVWLHAGSDMLFQQLQYQQLKPVERKLFQQQWHYISLSLIARPRRLLGTSLALYLNDNNGYITVNVHPHNNKTWQDYFNQYNSLDSTQSQILQQGWEKLLNHENPQKLEYPQCANHNTLNFNLQLRSLYEHTAVEIINKTTFFNQGIFVTEKFLNSVFGKNFPIFLANAGTVNYLRNSGFDMFDDVIDHRYDNESDPFQRLYKAVMLNKKLLQDKNFAIQKWVDCKSRFESNLYWAKNCMYKNFSEKFFNNFTLEVKS